MAGGIAARTGQGGDEENMAVTLKEIAQNCNVSVTTVSNILNGKPKVSEETRRRVLEAIDELEYHPNYFAQGLRRQKTMNIGIIAEDLAQFTTPDIVEGIMEWCEDKGYHILLQNLRLYARWGDTWYDQPDLVRKVLDPAVKELSSIKVDGIIYVAGHERKINYFPGNLSTPSVLAYCCSDQPVPSVQIDDETSGYEMVKYILSQGHTRIGVVCGRADNLHSMNRLLGYQRALYDAGVLYNPRWIKYGDWVPEQAYRATEELLREQVTAIFCMSDWMAGGVYTCIGEHGLKVGRDIAVTGFDDERAAGWYQPRLTSGGLPLHEIGSEAARILLEKLGRLEAGEDGDACSPEHVSIPCHLVVRDSVHRIGDAGQQA